MKRVIAVLVSLLFALVLIPTASAATTTAGQSGLSATGESAVEDLRTCVASEGVVNVYYLIDNSRSLDAADGQGSGSGSDPDVLRAQILSNSLKQLEGLDEGVRVNWAAGFFSTDFSSAIGWRPLDDAGPADLKSAIESRETAGYTNWPAALRGAQTQISAQQTAEPGCALLVWLTDGIIDIAAPDGQGKEDFDALNEMCGAPLNPAGAPATGYGIFDSLRQSGVVVIGALLATTETASAAGQDMRPLNEGVNADGVATCGQQPAPAGNVHGAFVEATSPDALAQVFRQLGALVGGGYPQPFDADGSFWIDPGVARFRILVSSDWTLHPPAGSSLPPASSASPQPWAVVDDGAINVAIADADAIGQWRLEAADARSLFLFSDLRIVFESANEIALSAEGNTTATLVAAVRKADGAAASLSDFQDGTFSAGLIGADGSITPLPGAVVDAETGEITIPVPAEVTSAEVVIQASINPLQTAPHGLNLAPITTQQTVKTVLPKDYPRVTELPVSLSVLEGRDGIASGFLTIGGPESGQAGQVCIETLPIVNSDSAKRVDTWAWTVDGQPVVPECKTVQPGETVKIPITAANPVAADSSVRASINVTVQSASGPALTQSVPIAFLSTHPVNALAVGLITFLLLVIGLILPLIVLWLFNWFSARLDVDQSMQRAAFPVTITPGSVVLPSAPRSETQLSDRFGYLSAANNLRSLNDADLGKLHAKVSWWPFRVPTYLVTPPAGKVIVAARTSARAGSVGERLSNGSVRFAQLPLDAFWAIVVPRTALETSNASAEVTGTAVIYHRADADAPEYRERLSDIEGDSTISGVVSRMQADALAISRERAARKRPKGSPAPTASPRSGQNAPPRVDAPPARPNAAGGASADSGQKSPPPPSRSDSTPPPRNDSGPPPRPSTGPPPRPSTGPPPRPSAG